MTLNGDMSISVTLDGDMSLTSMMDGEYGVFRDVGHVDYVLHPATTETLGGVIVGDDLQITPEGILSVVKANAVQADNTRPITSAAVYMEVGNINALLHTI